MRVVAFDTETYYDKDYGVKELGPYAYTRDLRFDCYLVSVSDGKTNWAGHPNDFNWESLEGATIVSHNAYFDRNVYDAMVERGTAPKVNFAAWHCTANLSAYLCNRRALADAVEHFYGQKPSKEMRDYMKGKTWSDAVKDGKAERLLEYARHDAYWCWRLWNDNSGAWPEDERFLSNLTIESGMYGVRVNVPLLGEYTQALQKELLEIERRIPWVEDGKRPSSPLGMAEACRAAGIPVPPVKAHDEEGFDAWVNEYKDKFPWATAPSEWRSISKVLGTLETIRKRLRPDGTIEAPLKYWGAHTGRFSGEAGINFQNFRRDPVKAAGLDVDVRKLFIARPGKKFLICDLSQIEPRVLAWVSDNLAMLDLVREGYSVYEAFARASGVWTEDAPLKEANPALYKSVKIQVLGLGYGAGWKKFKLMASQVGIKLTDEAAEAAVETFRRDNPKIPALWASLGSAVRASRNDGSFSMTLPSGRTMRYRDIRVQFRTDEDPETGLPVTKRVLTADVGGFRKSLYGGIICENLVQATARDVFAFHLCRLARAGFRIITTVHDEVIIEADEISGSVKEVERIMSETPPWLEGCPVAAEGHETDYFEK